MLTTYSPSALMLAMATELLGIVLVLTTMTVTGGIGFVLGRLIGRAEQEKSDRLNEKQRITNMRNAGGE